MAEDIVLPSVEEKPEEPKYVFPDISKGPACFYDDEKHQMWVGIDFNQWNNPIMITAYLDHAKLQSLRFLDQYAAFRADEMKKAIEKEKFKNTLMGRVADKAMSKLFGEKVNGRPN